MTYNYSYIKSVIKTYNYYKSFNIPIKDISYIEDTISSSTLYKWLKLYRNCPEINQPDKKPFNIEHKYKTNNKKINGDIQQFIIYCVTNDPLIASKDIQKKIKETHFTVDFSVNHISRILRDMNFTHKKVQKTNIYVTGEKFKLNKEILKQKIGNKNNRDIICVDETNIWFNDKINYGRSKANTKCTVHLKSRNKKEIYTLISAINNEQTVAETLIRGSCNTELFTKFITDSVLPNMKKNQKILMDNARIHRSHHFWDTMLINDITEDKFIYNVPYSPKYNPIEFSFNKKKKLIKQKVNNLDGLVTFLKSYNLEIKKTYDNYYKKSFDHLFDDSEY
jgi:transposase